MHLATPIRTLVTDIRIVESKDLKKWPIPYHCCLRIRP